MPKHLNPDFLKIGYIILIATRKFAIKKLQYKAGYGESSKWTHVAGSLGGYTAIEANMPHDVLQSFWFPLSIIYGKIGIILHNLFSSRKRFLPACRQAGVLNQ